MSTESDNWQPIIDSLQLTPGQLEVAKKFLARPDSRVFLPMAKTFLQHSLQQEGMELLIDGVQKDPSFGAARVFLAENYLQRGEFSEALTCLNESPIPLESNATALQVRLSCQILLGQRQAIEDLLFKYRLTILENRPLAHLAKLCQQSGHDVAKSYLEGELGLAQSDLANQPEDEDLNPAVDWTVDATRIPEETLRQRVGGFVRVPLEETLNTVDTPVEQRSMALDSETLAELYVDQGHFDKALAMYRRMLKAEPCNEEWIRRIRQVEKQTKTYRQDAISADVVDALEGTEFIDAQMGFYREMLEALDCPKPEKY